MILPTLPLFPSLKVFGGEDIVVVAAVAAAVVAAVDAAVVASEY